MREKLVRFMQGRYGMDPLGRFLLGLAVVFMILSMVFRVDLLYTLSLVCIVWGYIRMFSKNYGRRSAENAMYLRYTGRFWSRIYQWRKIADEKKVNHIYKCPDCGQKIRVPKGRGKIEISCPKCGKRFVKKS